MDYEFIIRRVANQLVGTPFARSAASSATVTSIRKLLSTFTETNRQDGLDTAVAAWKNSIRPFAKSVCNYHKDTPGWDDCSEDFDGECAVAKAKLKRGGLWAHIPRRDLEPGEPGSFKDMKITPRRDYLDTPPEELIECPKCKGYGGWNLKLDAYGKGKHFQAGCSQCNSWGWVKKDSPDATCMHEYAELSGEECRRLGITHFGMCWHVYRCKKCGETMSQDSSD